MAKIITGAHASIGPSLPDADEVAPQPHWNTATITPYAAPIDSRFMITAFSGTSTLRNTTISSRNDSSSTTPDEERQHARTCSRRSRRRRRAARRPARSTSVPATAGGTTSSRRRSTRSSVASSCGDVVGNTCMIAASPAALGCGGVANATPGRRRSACRDSLVSTARSAAPFGRLGREQQRAVEAGPEALGEQVVRLAASCRPSGWLPASAKPSRIENTGSASRIEQRQGADERRASGRRWIDAAPAVPERLVLGRRAACGAGGRTGRCCGRRSRAARAAA